MLPKRKLPQLMLSVFAISLSALAHAQSTRYQCQYVERELAGTPLNFEIKEFAENKIAVQVAEATLPGFLRGFQEPNIPLESLHSEPLRMLKIPEWDLDEVKFYYAYPTATDESYVMLWLVLVNTFDSGNELKFNGAYGTYDDRSFLCFK